MLKADQQYSGRTRIRVCGVLIEHNHVLLIQLHSPVSDVLVWTPPGGSVHFQEPLVQTLEREFLEETGLAIEVKEQVFINELIEGDFHAIEFFYTVKRIGGELKLGTDPERAENDQILKDLRFIPISELNEYMTVPKNLFETKIFK